MAALVSGGKDSVAAVAVARQWGWDVVATCTLRVRGDDSYMFHRPNAQWAPLVAEAMGIPALVGETAGEKERELDDLERLLARARDEAGADAVVSGALASEYQRTRIERVGHRLGMKTFTPLWHKAAADYLRWLIGARYHVRFVAVSAEGLGRGWLGRLLTPRALEHLEAQAARFGFHPAGEGGEYETLVTDGPDFLRPIEVTRTETHWHRDSGWWEIHEARLGAAHAAAPPIPDE